MAVASPATIDISGTVQVGSAATFFARIEPRFKEMEDKGVVEKTSHMVIMDESFTLTERQTQGMLIWLPPDSSSDATLARRVKIVTPCYDERGSFSHIELHI